MPLSLNDSFKNRITTSTFAQWSRCVVCCVMCLPHNFGAHYSSCCCDCLLMMGLHSGVEASILKLARVSVKGRGSEQATPECAALMQIVLS